MDMEGLSSFHAPRSLKDRVYEALKTDIIYGRLQAGQQLNIAELASTMGISSAPVREALSMLYQDGFVMLMPRKKAIVAEYKTKDAIILMELRKMLEPYAASLCVGNIPENEIQMTSESLENVSKNPEDIDAYIKSDLDLHDLIVRWCGSQIFGDILKTLKEHSLRMRYNSVEGIVDKADAIAHVLQSTKEHIAILNALKNVDPDASFEAMNQHLINTLQRTDFTTD